MQALSGGLAGLGVSSRLERSSKGRDNVLVCVRCAPRSSIELNRVLTRVHCRIRPPAAKLAAATTLVEERAWDVDEASGRLALKTGHPEFAFGE